MLGFTRRRKAGAFSGKVGIALCVNACSPWEQLREGDFEPPRDRAPTDESKSAEGESDTSSPKVDTSGWSREKLFAYFNKLRGDAYPLDEIPRHLEAPDSKVPCLAEDQQIYRGTHVKFVPITVHPAFAQRLEKLEQLLAEQAEVFYGRPPSTVLHEGGYACRASHFRSMRISEHAFGNAVDITGFSFGSLSREKAEAVSGAVPKGAFQVRILTHWKSKGGPFADLHQSFLRSVGERIVEEKLFRVVLGPNHRGHESHFHLDMSPWRYVDL